MLFMLVISNTQNILLPLRGYTYSTENMKDRYILEGLTVNDAAGSLRLDIFDLNHRAEKSRGEI